MNDEASSLVERGRSTEPCLFRHQLPGTLYKYEIDLEC